MFNERILKEQSQKYDSFYIYDEKIIVQYIETLKKNFHGVQFLYSIKANSNPMVVKSVLSHGFGADAASFGEVQIGLKNGLRKENIYYSAPGKTIDDIEKSINSATLIADSPNEIEHIQTIAYKNKMVANIGIRINPDFSFYDDNGHPSKFGIDENLAIKKLKEWKKYTNIRISGIHIHLKSQELNSNVLAGYYEKIFQLADKIQYAYGNTLNFINMGSGMGIQYSCNDTPLNIADLGNKSIELINSFKKKFPSVNVFIEVGRYAVGKAGFYVTKVLDKKISHGKTFIILSNTLNGFLRPSLAHLIMRYAKNTIPEASEPLFTGKYSFEILTFKEKSDVESVSLAGNLCTASDIIADAVELPKLECGDIIVITNAGSYGAVLSPAQFSSQNKPVELFMTKSGVIIDTQK